MSPTADNTGWYIRQWDEHSIPESELILTGQQLNDGLLPLPTGMPSPTKINGIQKEPRSSLGQWEHPAINPWRIKARRRRVVAYPVLGYCDDTSGNRSKKWNEHNSYLFTPAGLERQHAQQEANIHFVCTSDSAEPLEMLDAIATEFE